MTEIPEPETIVEAIETDLSDEWALRSVVLASDDDDGRLYLLVFRTTTSDDGNLILSERYYRFDPVSRSGQFLDNGIERRVTGSMMNALMVVANGLARGGADVGDPMLIDSRDADMDQTGGPLDVPLDDLGDDLQPLDTVDDAESRQPDDDVEQTGECDECGAERPTDELVTLSLGGVEYQRCRGECPDDGGDQA